MRIAVFITAAAFSILTAAQAFASPSLGDSVTCTVTGGGTFGCASAKATVGPGVEFLVGDSSSEFLGIDFDQNSLTVANIFAGSGFLANTILVFTDTTSPFNSVSLVSNGGFSGYDPSRTTVSNGTLTVDLKQTAFSTGASLQFSLAGAAIAIPEPPAWAIMIPCFGVVGSSLWRRKKITTRGAYPA